MAVGGRLPSPSSSAQLARLGFADSVRAGRLLAAIGLPADHPVSESLGAAADPDLALTALTRLVEAADADLIAELTHDPGLRARLIAVLGASAVLGDHLAAHPADWRALAGDGVITVRPSAYGLVRTLLAAVGADHPDASAVGTGNEAITALRTAYRRCLLTLAARDLTGVLAVDEVAAELADLAAATLAAALTVARASLPGDAAPARLAVIAMGKCGGRELNYASDVDVVFVAEPKSAGDAEMPALHTATRLATELIRICGQVAWPVDPALRPEGKDGPLTRTLASHQAYYRRWARTWEFQALLKARPVAGDTELGQRYVDTLAPLVWTAGEREHFVEDVQAMRRRVEEQLPAAESGRELKLGPGGLRDVEFAVQLLQLVHGRADDSLRSPSTLVALDALAGGGYVGRDDARQLADSYRFLRTVEHRLQLQRLRRTHTVPTDRLALRWLARATGCQPTVARDVVEAFEQERARHGREVRRLHEKLFYRPLLAAVARLPTDEARLRPEAARARLEALGFADPVGALRHLQALTSGVSRRAAIQRTLLPAMLGAFADAADPDAGLLSYRQVSDALGTTPWYLRRLRDEGAAAERLARLLAGSRYLADLLGRAPTAVALLADDAELVPRPVAQLSAELAAVTARYGDDAESAAVAARGLRRQELLRVAAADLLGRLDIDDVGTALSSIARATIEAALGVAIRTVETDRREALPARIAILAMGRLGGGEQGYGSDADVLFVYQPVDGADDRAAATAAQQVCQELRRLLAVPAPDPPLTVDADLRPEGRAGPLVRSLASYAAYYRRWSSVWEAQALLRAAPAAGDPALTAQFLGIVDPVRYPAAGLTATQVTEVRRIKARVEAERLPRGADPLTHLKLGPGGLADIEWTAQLLQLRHAGLAAGLRTTATLAALTAARDAGRLDACDAAVLDRAWRLAARARNAVMLVTGRGSDQLPVGGRALAGVARVLGYPAGRQQDLLEDQRRAARRARQVVERVFYG